jgi:hypothetical protein
MPDLSRRLLCRVMFVLLCIGPTICVGMYAVLAHWQRERDELYRYWETRILQETGFQATLASIEPGKRGDMVFRDVILSDPETKEEVVRVRRVHLAPAGQRGWVVDVSYPELAAHQLARLWEPLYDRLRSSRGPGDWSGFVAAHHVTLRRGDEADSLSQFECQFGSGPSGGFAQMEFLLDGYGMTERARVRVHRHRDKSPPETTVFIQTGPRPLPCSALAEFVPALRFLGKEAHFQGQSEWRLGSSGWRGERFEGKVSNIDFATLVTDLFPHHLWSGRGELEIRRAEFEAGRLISAEGILLGEAGTISLSLLGGAIEQLGWKISQQLPSDHRLRYRRLGFDFRIDPNGLVLRGRCGSPGVILENDQGPLVWEHPQGTPAQVVDLVRVLVPETRHQVPATRQTAWLTNHLPVPAYEPSSRNARLPPDSPPVRLRE